MLETIKIGIPILYGIVVFLMYRQIETAVTDFFTSVPPKKASFKYTFFLVLICGFLIIIAELAYYGNVS